MNKNQVMIIFMILLIMIFMISVSVLKPYHAPEIINTYPNKVLTELGDSANSLTLTNDQAILWWMVYKTTSVQHSVGDSVYAANQAVEHSYKK